MPPIYNAFQAEAPNALCLTAKALAFDMRPGGPVVQISPRPPAFRQRRRLIMVTQPLISADSHVGLDHVVGHLENFVGLMKNVEVY